MAAATAMAPTTEAPDVAPEIPSPQAPALALGGAAALARLQRVAGNRAVGSLLRGRSSARVSRCGAGGCTCGACRAEEPWDEEHARRLARAPSDGTAGRLAAAAAARRAVARQAPESGPASDPSDPVVPMEKTWPGLEQQYRLRGDHREADAIRACRLLGGEACARILTIEEVHALLAVANGAGGDPAKVEEGVQKDPLLAKLALVRGGARTAPRPGLTPAQLGLLVVLQMVVQIGQLQELSEFEETLRRFDYVILDSPDAVFCRGCHPSGPILPPAEEEAPPFEIMWDWLPPPTETRPLEQPEAAGPRGGRPQPQVPVPAPPVNPNRTRHPDQICDDAVYDRLRAVVVNCKARSFGCSDAAERDAFGITTRKAFNAKGAPRWDCPELLRRLRDAEFCEEARREFQNTCFGANSDAGHDQQVGDWATAIANCTKKAQDRGCFGPPPGP